MKTPSTKPAAAVIRFLSPIGRLKPFGRLIISAITAFHLPIVREVGGFRPEFGEAAIYDLALRVSEKTASIRHVPLVLCHSPIEASRRVRPGGTNPPAAPRFRNISTVFRRTAKSQPNLRRDFDASAIASVGRWSRS